MSFFTVLTYTDRSHLWLVCSLCPVLSLKTGTVGEKKMKMVIFSEGCVVLGSWDIVLFSRAVKTCGLHRRGNCSCGQCIVYVLDTRCRIIWLALFLELLGKEVNTNRNIVGLIAEMLASNSATELTYDLGWGCGFGQSWESPVIWDLWVFVITAVSLICGNPRYWCMQLLHDPHLPENLWFISLEFLGPLLFSIHII